MNRFLQNLIPHNGNNISLKENNKSLVFNCGDDKFYIIKIDDFQGRDFLPFNTTRCDYILCHENKNLAIFIELKGTDLDKAFEQIINTNNLFGNNLNKKYAAIVYKGIPGANNKIQNFKIKNAKIFSDFFIKTDSIKLKFDNNVLKYA